MAGAALAREAQVDATSGAGGAGGVVLGPVDACHCHWVEVFGGRALALAVHACHCAEAFECACARFIFGLFRVALERCGVVERHCGLALTLN